MTTDNKLMVRPVEPTPAWTFASASSVLEGLPLSDALDEFLLYNQDVLLDPMPFRIEKIDSANSLKAGDSEISKSGNSSKLGNFSKENAPSSDNTPSSDSLKHFHLRGVLYEGASEDNIAVARDLGSFLGLDVKEVLRIILQTKKRVPDDSIAARPVSADTLYACAVLGERRTVLDIGMRCFHARFHENASLVVRNVGKSYLVNGEYVQRLVEGLRDCHHRIVASETGRFSAELLALVRNEFFLHMVVLLRFLHDLLLESAEYDKQSVAEWFAFMEDSDFGGAYVQEAGLFGLVSGLFTVISLKFLELNADSPSSAPYFNDVQVFSALTSVISTSPNTIVKYGLLLSLYKKSIFLEERPEQNEAFLDSELSLSAIQSLTSTLQAEIGSSVFSEIQQLCEYLRFDESYSVALVELILAALPVISINDEFVSCIGSVLQKAPALSVETFFDSPDAQQLFVLSRAKFPMIMIPFLKMAAINGDFALHELEEMRSYMQAFDQAQFNRVHEIDSDNTSLVRLSQSIDVYPQYETSKKLSLLLNQDTKAQVFQPDDGHKVWVTFLYKYNGWAFLGRVLENISKSFDGSNPEKMALLESILILIRQVTCQTEAAVALEYMSVYTDDADILDVVFRLLEQCLHERNAEFSAILLDILALLMPMVISRIWPYLSTSSLFSRHGKEGFAAILFGSLEMVRGDYSFTVSLAEFALALMENCLSTSDDYAPKSKAEILAQITGHLLQVFSASCNYNDGYQKLRLGTLLLKVFSVSLEAVFSIGPESVPDQKPTRIFAAAADQVLDAFLLGNNDSASRILESIERLASFTNMYELADKSGFSGDVWARTCLKFSKLVTQIRTSAGRPPSVFEKGLFRKLPQIVMVYAKGGMLREYVLDLLSALTNGKWSSVPEPSMLSHLGPSHSRIFLHSLAADLENPFDDQNIKIPIYKFLCALMEANQQGLSVFFISGRDVFGEVVGEKETPRKTVSLLSILKRNINDINYLPPAVTVHLLDAISLAFSSWTIARNEESDDVFVQELISMMGGFQKKKDAEKDAKKEVWKKSDAEKYEKWGVCEELYRASNHCKLYAKIAETLSLLLFTSKNDRCRAAIVDYLGGAEFLARIPDFFSVSDYNSVLYDEVNSQFSAVFPGFNLSDFAVSFKERNQFGMQEVYDLQVLEAMFGKHARWPEIRHKIMHCGANIQYYNAQHSLGKSMGGLLTTLCRRSPQTISGSFSKAAFQLLTIREPRDTYTQDFYKQQAFAKIELAFLLLYTGHCNGTSFSSQAIPIVEASLVLMADENVGYLNFRAPKSSEYSYRSLLRILYVSLSQIGHNPEMVALNHQILMKVFDFVVSSGTRGLIEQLENHVYLKRKTEKTEVGKTPERQDKVVGETLGDFELILSILKLFTQMNLSRALQSEIMASLRRNKTVEAICSLHTFSHLVFVGNNEPVFAQLSLMFIQQFLSLDEFCDNLAQYNLFTVIRESMISRPFKEGGVSVENNVQLHRNWINGILPIVVTCLAKKTVLSEVILTIRAFQKQIEFCAGAWTKDSASLHVSTAGTFETMQILYIYKMLHEITSARGISVTSSTEVDMSILPGFDTPQKRAYFGDFVSNLLKHPKFLASRISPSSPEEELLLSRSDEKYHTFVKTLINDISELKVLVEA